jgi:hypothetical protein
MRSEALGVPYYFFSKVNRFYFLAYAVPQPVSWLSVCLSKFAD